eukprot:1127047-Lingulodinium_polyedra.AAC.1
MSELRDWESTSCPKVRRPKHCRPSGVWRSDDVWPCLDERPFGRCGRWWICRVAELRRYSQ